MLKSILRIAILAVIVIAVAWGLSWVVQNGGQVPIQLNGREYRPTLWAIVLGIVAALFVFWLFVKLVELGLALIAFIMGDKNAISRVFGRRRRARGMKALETSALALSIGDSKTALSNAYRAQKDLDQPILTSLMVAQSAKQQGKTKEAEEAYKKLLSTNKAGRFVGIRGLMEEKRLQGDQKAAAQLATKALEIRPNDKDVVNDLFYIQVKEGDWKGARETLKSKVKLEKTAPDIAHRQEATLAISEAKTLDREENAKEYVDLVTRAYTLDPSLVPAAAMAARAQAKAGQKRKADNIIVKSWSVQPHPELASTFAELVPNETPDQRLRRFKVLTKRQKTSDETKMLTAELLVANEDFPAARRAMGELADNPKTARQYAIMAAIENGEGADDTIVRAYLARAMTASRGHQWVCSNCHEVHGEWQAVCDNCGHFDTTEWKVPPEGTDQDQGMGVLMPLLMNSNAENAGSHVSETVNAEADIEDAEVIVEVDEFTVKSA